jgi:hypothetical protein
VDWLYLSAGVGDDGNERTSFMKEDFSPLPTVAVAGVGYLPTRVLGGWHCRYSTRRSSYGVETARSWFDAIARGGSFMPRAGAARAS